MAVEGRFTMVVIHWVANPFRGDRLEEAWLQWITTSSPGCQRVTPGPTFQTTPEASEPPMWWPYSGWSP